MSCNNFGSNSFTCFDNANNCSLCSHCSSTFTKCTFGKNGYQNYGKEKCRRCCNPLPKVENPQPFNWDVGSYKIVK